MRSEQPILKIMLCSKNKLKSADHDDCCKSFRIVTIAIFALLLSFSTGLTLSILSRTHCMDNMQTYARYDFTEAEKRGVCHSILPDRYLSRTTGRCFLDMYINNTKLVFVPWILNAYTINKKNLNSDCRRLCIDRDVTDN